MQKKIRRRKRSKEKSSQAHHQVKLLKQIIDNTKVSQFSHTKIFETKKKKKEMEFCVQFLMQPKQRIELHHNFEKEDHVTRSGSKN